MQQSLRWSCAMGAAAFGVLIAAQGFAAASPPDGVEIETVVPASLAAKAGLQAGDRLSSWSRAASAAAPAGAGEIRSPFDLALVLIEQTPRGAVSLHGRHSEAAASWPLAGPPPWGAEILPALPADLLVLYRDGRQRVAAGDLDAGAESWRAAAAQALSGGDPGIAAWFHLRRARALSEAARWPAADTAFDDAVAALRPAAPAAAAQILREQGEALQRRSAWDRAMDCYNRALALDRAVAPESLAVAADLAGLGTTAGRKGDLGGSTEPLHQARPPRAARPGQRRARRQSAQPRRHRRTPGRSDGFRRISAAIARRPRASFPRERRRGGSPQQPGQRGVAPWRPRRERRPLPALAGHL